MVLMDFLPEQMRLFRLFIAVLISIALSATNVAAATGMHCAQTEGNVQAASGAIAASAAFGAHGAHAAAQIDDAAGKAHQHAGHAQHAHAGPSVAFDGDCSHCSYCQSCMSPALEAQASQSLPLSARSIEHHHFTERVTATVTALPFRPPRMRLA